MIACCLWATALEQGLGAVELAVLLAGSSARPTGDVPVLLWSEGAPAPDSGLDQCSTGERAHW
jgi:hypothetical protein